MRCVKGGEFLGVQKKCRYKLQLPYMTDTKIIDVLLKICDKQSQNPVVGNNFQKLKKKYIKKYTLGKYFRGSKCAFSALKSIFTGATIRTKIRRE